MRIGFGLGPFYVSQRIGGRRRNRKPQASGCGVVPLTLGAVLVGGWPFMLGIHAWAWLIAVPWWAALALVYFVPKHRQAIAQRREADEMKAAEHEALARIQAEDLERQIVAQQAVEDDLARLRQEAAEPAIPPSYARVSSGPPFHAEVVIQGKAYTCEHQHRTQTAGAECAKRMAREKFRELGLGRPEFRLREEGS